MKKEINVVVKRWFDDINGNTYHSVQFKINNDIYHSGLTYGYERQYETTFKSMLNNWASYIPSYTIIEDCTENELEKITEYK